MGRTTRNASTETTDSATDSAKDGTEPAPVLDAIDEAPVEEAPAPEAELAGTTNEAVDPTTASSDPSVGSSSGAPDTAPTVVAGPDPYVDAAQSGGVTVTAPKPAAPEGVALADFQPATQPEYVLSEDGKPVRVSASAREAHVQALQNERSNLARDEDKNARRIAEVDAELDRYSDEPTTRSVEQA